ncbi:MAG TPA: histidine phosphatase family protein [Candidatus Microsaccharimonas sp.]
MAMPNELVFVRHGQSEANIIQKAGKAGQPHDMESVINDRPDWRQRLSPKGIEQARLAKVWIDENMGGVAVFDALYVSSFLRTRETAAHLSGNSDARWTIDDRLIERSWGSFGATPIEERGTQFPHTVKMQQATSWFTRFDGGENMPDVSGRYRDFQGTLHREMSEKKVLVVSHGDFINVSRYNIERMLPEQWEDMDKGDQYTLRNCTIVRYSRINPDDPQDIREKLRWRQMIYPDAIHESPDGAAWVELPIRQRFIGSELLEQVEIAPPLLGKE